MSTGATTRTAGAGVGWLDVAEKGSVLGIQVLVWICTLFGRAPGRAVLRVVVLYYVAVYGSARRASRAYLQRIHGEATLGMIYRHLLSFAEVSLDRMFMASGRHHLFDVKGVGIEIVRDLAAQRRGAILLGAHLGSFEALRMQAETDQARLNVVGHFRNARRINAALERLNPALNTRVIDVDPASMGFVLQIKESVARGELVAILGDRALPGARTVSVPFLGEDAAFPTGAFQLAAMLRCPVVLVCGLYRGDNRYELHCERFDEQVVLPRGARAEALYAYVERFAARLEHLVRLAPDNWFNFYDFWATPAARGAAPLGAPPGDDAGPAPKPPGGELALG